MKRRFADPEKFQAPGRGDLHVVIKVETPKKLNDEQRELLQKFADSMGEDVMPQRKTFFDVFRDNTSPVIGRNHN